MTRDGFSLIVGGTEPSCCLDFVLVVCLGAECFRIPADTMKERPPSRGVHKHVCLPTSTCIKVKLIKPYTPYSVLEPIRIYERSGCNTLNNAFLLL